MRPVLIALMTLLLAASTHAQGMKGSKKLKSDGPPLQRKKGDDKAYSDALKKIPDQPKADPWSGMR